MSMRTAGSKRRWILASTALVTVIAGGMNTAALAQTESSRPASEAAPQAEQGRFGELEQIVVTAQKRQETLQSVPMSIKAMSDAELQKAGANSFVDVAGRIPALSFRSSGPGRQKLTLRGISSSSGAPTVSFYVDEVPLAAASSASNTSFQQGNVDPNLFDVERIEVLRGPQGTLYGASSMGGTVKVVTKQPDTHDFSAKINGQVSSTAHGGENVSANASVNLPIVEDKLALRVTGSYIDNAGYIDRVIGDFDFDGRVDGPLASDVHLPSRAANPAVPVKTIKDVNTEKTRSVRAALRLEVNDDFYIQPSVFAQRTTQDGKSSYDSRPGTLEQRRAFDLKEPYEDKFVLGNLTMNYDLGAVSVLSSTSYLDRDIRNSEDFTDLLSYYFGYSNDPNDLPAQRRISPSGDVWDLSGPPFPATVQPYPGMANETVGNKDFTQELRVTSNTDGAFSWILGFYYKHTKGRAGYDFIVPGYGDAFPAWQAILGGTFGNTFALNSGATKYEEYAAFGEGRYSITDRLHLTVGARWFSYKNEFDRSVQGLFFGTPVPRSITGSAKDNGINPKVLLSYDYAEEAQVYVTAAKGYRPGAGNAPIPANRCQDDLAVLGLSDAPTSYGPDKLWNYELGTKSRFADGRATLNAAVYYIDWSDVQQRINLPQCGANYTDNAGAAKSRGFEIEFDALLTDNFKLSGGVGYNKATFKSGAPFTGIVKGDRLLDAPEWTLNVSGEYVFPAFAGGDGYLRASWSYVDDSLDLKGVSKNGYSLVDLRAGITIETWEASVFVNNLLDKQAELTTVDTIGQTFPTYSRIVTNRPRTIGVSVTKSF